MSTERVSVGCATCGATDLPIIGHADVCPGAPERGCDRCGDHVEDGSGHYVGQYRVCSECNESPWAAFMRARASVAAGSGVSVELIERGSDDEWPTFALAWVEEDGRAWQATVQAASESAAEQAWIEGDIIGSRPAESFELGEGEREMRDPYDASVTAWVAVGVDGILLRPIGTHPDSSNIIIEVHDGGEVRVYCGKDAETVHCFDLATGKYEGVEA